MMPKHIHRRSMTLFFVFVSFALRAFATNSFFRYIFVCERANIPMQNICTLYIPYWYVYSSCINAVHFTCCGMRVSENIGRKKCILHFFKSPCKMRAKYTQFKDDSDRSKGKCVRIMQCRKFFRPTNFTIKNHKRKIWSIRYLVKGENWYVLSRFRLDIFQWWTHIWCVLKHSSRQFGHWVFIELLRQIGQSAFSETFEFYEFDANSFNLKPDYSSISWWIEHFSFSQITKNFHKLSYLCSRYRVVYVFFLNSF